MIRLKSSSPELFWLRIAGALCTLRRGGVAITALVTATPIQRLRTIPHLAPTFAVPGPGLQSGGLVSEPNAKPPLVAVALTMLPSMLQCASAPAPISPLPLADASEVQFALAKECAPPPLGVFALSLAVAFALPEAEVTAWAAPPFVAFAMLFPPELLIASAKAFLIATACALPSVMRKALASLLPFAFAIALLEPSESASQSLKSPRPA